MKGNAEKNRFKWKVAYGDLGVAGLFTWHIAIRIYVCFLNKDSKIIEKRMVIN